MFTENVKAILRRAGAELTEELNKQLEALAKNPPPQAPKVPDATIVDWHLKPCATATIRFPTGDQVEMMAVDRHIFLTNEAKTKADQWDKMVEFFVSKGWSVDLGISQFEWLDQRLVSGKGDRVLPEEAYQTLCGQAGLMDRYKREVERIKKEHEVIIDDLARNFFIRAGGAEYLGAYRDHTDPVVLIKAAFTQMERAKDMAQERVAEIPTLKRSVEIGAKQYRLLVDRIIRTQKVKQLIDAVFNQEKTGMSVMDIHRLLATPSSDAEIDKAIQSYGDDHITSVFPD